MTQQRVAKRAARAQASAEGRKYVSVRRSQQEQPQRTGANAPRAEAVYGPVWTAFEDERGNLYEVPDDDGRIRVSDLDGDTVSWYDPGDDGYDSLAARMCAETLFEHLTQMHSADDTAGMSPADAITFHSQDHAAGVSGPEHEHPGELVWPMEPAPAPEVVWAEVADGELGFTLPGGGFGNPGCDECGMDDAVARVDGTYLCEASLGEAPWRTQLARWRKARDEERCDECGAVCGGYDGVSYTHEGICSMHPRNVA